MERRIDRDDLRVVYKICMATGVLARSIIGYGNFVVVSIRYGLSQLISSCLTRIWWVSSTTFPLVFSGRKCCPLVSDDRQMTAPPEGLF